MGPKKAAITLAQFMINAEHKKSDHMKITRKWVTLVLALAPGIYLASCGSGNRDRDNSDTLSTQSAPPSDVQSSTSDQRNMGDSSAMSGRTESPSGTEGTTNSGSTGTTGNTGTGTSENATGSTGKTSTTNNSGLTGSTGTTGTTTTEAYEANKSTRSSGVSSTRKSSSKKYGTTNKRHSRSYGTKSRKATNRSETTQIKRSERDNTNVADTAANRIRRLGDTTSTRVKRFGDTLSNKIDRMDIDMDTSVRNKDMMGNEFDSNRGNISGLRGRDRQGNFADTNDSENKDTSRNFSTQRSGMSFTPQRFISKQFESNYGEIKMDSNIKTWVTRTLPTLRKHRDELNRFSNRSPK